jgi:hypothetical protein
MVSGSAERSTACPPDRLLAKDNYQRVISEKTPDALARLRAQGLADLTSTSAGEVLASTSGW